MTVSHRVELQSLSTHLRHYAPSENADVEGPVGLRARRHTRPCRDDSRGEPAIWCTKGSCHYLLFGGAQRPPDHDAVMRIGTARLRSGGPILLSGMKPIDTPGTPPPRTVIGDP